MPVWWWFGVFDIALFITMVIVAIVLQQKDPE